MEYISILSVTSKNFENYCFLSSGAIYKEVPIGSFKIIVLVSLFFFYIKPKSPILTDFLFPFIQNKFSSLISQCT
jgi:hypothetical protein